MQPISIGARGRIKGKSSKVIIASIVTAAGRMSCSAAAHAYWKLYSQLRHHQGALQVVISTAAGCTERVLREVFPQSDWAQPNDSRHLVARPTVGSDGVWLIFAQSASTDGRSLCIAYLDLTMGLRCWNEVGSSVS